MVDITNPVLPLLQVIGWLVIFVFRQQYFLTLKRERWLLHFGGELFPQTFLPPVRHLYRPPQNISGTQEVTVDGTKVLSKSGRHKHEWRNRLRWRRKKSEDYELHVVEDGIEVRLGEKTVWGIAADHIMG